MRDVVGRRRTIRLSFSRVCVMGNQGGAWYDPKQYRKKPIDISESPPSRYRTYLVDDDARSRASNWWLSILTWGAVFAALYFAFASYFQKRTPQPNQPPIVQANVKQTNACPSAELPENGSVRILESAVMKRSDVPYSGLSFKNDHSTAITATILHGEKKIASVLTLPGQIAELSAPVGHYALQLAWGTKWCGQERDFEDQHLVNVTSGIASQHGQTTAVLVESDPVAKSGLRLTNLTKPLPTPVADQPPLLVSPGELAVKADRLGHFRIHGKVNDRAVTFLVDTGASFVAISRKMANEVGIYNCAFNGSSNTANGRVDACIAKGIAIEFGNFRVPNVDLLILPNMDDEVLLGMNVLKHMQIQQSNGILRLTAR